MKINSQNIFTFIITFIPSQRYVSYIFFFLIILQKMIVWEEKHPLKKKKIIFLGKSKFLPLCQLFHLFSKKILLTMHHDNGQFRNVVDTNVADRTKVRVVDDETLFRYAFKPRRGHGSFNGASFFAVKAFLRASFVRYHSWYIKIKRWKDGA